MWQNQWSSEASSSKKLLQNLQNKHIAVTRRVRTAGMTARGTPVAPGETSNLFAMPETLPVTGSLAPSQAEVRVSAPSAFGELVPGAGLIARLDSVAAVTAILGVLISVNMPTISGSLDSFLSTRISIKNILLLIFLAAAWPAVCRVFCLYSARRVRHFRSEAGRLIAATTAGTVLASVFPLTSVSGSLGLEDLPRFWLALLGLSLLVRSGRRAVDWSQNGHVRRALIVGTGRLAQRIYRDLEVNQPDRYHVVGFVDEPSDSSGGFNRFEEQTIHGLDALEDLLMRDVIDDVFIALPVKSCYQQIQQAIAVCERAGIEAKYGADLFESTVASPRYDATGDRAFVAMQVAPRGYRLLVKRAVDIVGALAALVVFAPVLLIAATAIKLTSRGPVIYAQDRCGFNKRPLRMYKFRSMFVNADALQASLESHNEASGPVFKIRNDPRITPLGRVLRKWSIDELPQLWNVLRGDMSLVGPRPLPWRDVRRITRPSDMRRFSMRPGLTCLWQVQGRSTLSFERWVELDLKYIDTWSLQQDLWILVKTIPAVLSANGAS